MNPGPAPRPPPSIDRLHIHESSSTTTLGSMSARSIASPITTSATSTYSGNVVPLPVARSQGGPDGAGVSIIKQGWASVREGKSFLKAWNQKYLVLRKEKLDFHKTENGKIVYFINLRDVVGVSRVEAAGVIFEIKRNGGDSTAPGDEDGNTKTLQIKVKSDDDLYEWIDYIYARCPGMGGVSNPTNFAHAVHVGFDPNTGEFVGLPPEWSKLLNSSAITKEDYERNPQAVFEVLEFYSEIGKRADDPQYASLTPTPPASSSASKQLGYMGGNSVAPPRAPMQRNDSYSTIGSNGGRPPPADQAQQVQQMKQMAAQFTPNVNREEQRQKDQEMQRRRQDEQDRKDFEEYQASMPQQKPSSAQQEVGGYGGSTNDRYNPSRAAPTPPGTRPQNPPGPLRAQRQAPTAPNGNQRPQLATQSSSASISSQATTLVNENGRISPPRADPRYQNGTANNTQPSMRPPNNQPSMQRTQAPAQIKPLNVAKQPTGAPTKNDTQASMAVKAAELALTSKPTAAERKDARMSTMSESEVMARLRDVVSKDDPMLSYSKQKKIGQGASGSVYVAKVKENAVSPVARGVLRDFGNRAQVAIKQMDLAHQPRKELIVNEIMVMKDSKHKNIVNFLDSFLRNNSSELWVIMEFMEGGALTDVIDNNPVITEDQISTICHEVSWTISNQVRDIG